MDFLIALFFVIASIGGFVSYVPQIIKLLRTKKAEDISLMSWAVGCINSSSYFGYIILTSPRNIGLLLLCGLDVVFIFTIFILTKYYQCRGNRLLKKKKKEEGNI